jgi:hypothetical protein
VDIHANVVYERGLQETLEEIKDEIDLDYLLGICPFFYEARVQASTEVCYFTDVFLLRDVPGSKMRDAVDSFWSREVVLPVKRQAHAKWWGRRVKRTRRMSPS